MFDVELEQGIILSLLLVSAKSKYPQLAQAVHEQLQRQQTEIGELEHFGLIYAAIFSGRIRDFFRWAELSNKQGYSEMVGAESFFARKIGESSDHVDNALHALRAMVREGEEVTAWSLNIVLRALESLNDQRNYTQKIYATFLEFVNMTGMLDASTFDVLFSVGSYSCF